MRNRIRCYALALLLAVAGSGCTQPATSPPASAKGSPRIADGQTLPDRVDSLKGTAFLSIAPDLTAAIKNPPAEGAYFVLLSPHDPTRGVLVYAGMKPDEVARRASGVMTVSGTVKKFTDPAFKQHVKDKYQMNLAAAGDDVQVVMAEGDLFPPVATATPGASSTPAK